MAGDDIVTELLAAGAKSEETDKVAYLLLTLPSTYDGVITAIETLSEDNLTLAFVKTRLMDHEVKLKNECDDTTSYKVLHIENTTFTPQKRKFENSIISNSQPFTKQYNGQAKKNLYNLKCYHCGRNGHKKADCYYFKRNYNQQENTERTRTVQAVELINNQVSASNESGFAFMTGVY